MLQLRGAETITHALDNIDLMHGQLMTFHNINAKEPKVNLAYIIFMCGSKLEHNNVM